MHRITGAPAAPVIGAYYSNWLAKPALPILAGVILTLPSLWVGLALDDLWHWAVLAQPESLSDFIADDEAMFSFGDGDPERNRRMIGLGMFPWWTVSDFKVQFWRPFTELTHKLDYLLWPDTAWLMHLHTVLWYAGLIALVAAFYRRWLTPAWVAGFAALLYAIDEARGLPVGWLANRNATLSAFFAIATLLLHDVWRRDQKNWAAPLALLALAAGLLSNEGAVCITTYLFAYALFLDKSPLRVRAMTLLPYATLVIAWQVAYSLQNYGAHGSQLYVNPPEDPVRFLEGLLVRFPALMMSLWSPIASEFVAFAPLSTQIVVAIFASVLFALIALVISPLLRTDLLARFFFTGMVLSAIPACATFPSDRLMYIPGIGAMGLIAQFVLAWREGRFASHWSGLGRVLARSALVCLIVTHLIIAPLVLVGKIAAVGFAGRVFDTMALGAPLGEHPEDATVIVVDAPNIFVTTYLPIARAHKNVDFPTKLIGLAPMTPAGVPMTFHRPDADTLTVEPEGGYPWFLFRSDEFPFSAGERVELEGWAVTILEVDARGVPQRIQVDFAWPLEDRRYVWLEFKGANLLSNPENVYIPFTPPKIGETVKMNLAESGGAT